MSLYYTQPLSSYKPGTVTEVAAGNGLIIDSPTGNTITSTGTISRQILSPSPAGNYTDSTLSIDSYGRVISASSGQVGPGGGSSLVLPYSPTNDYKNSLIIINGTGSNGSTNIKNIGYLQIQPNIFGNTQISDISDPYSQYNGVIAFDGAGDYITFNDNQAFGFGFGEFLFQCWIYLTDYPSAGTYATIFDTSGPERLGIPRGGTGVIMGISSNGILSLYVEGGSYNFGSAGDIQLNTWYHVAFNRLGFLYVFLNGTNKGSVNYAGADFNSPTMTIGTIYSGRANNNVWKFKGYMSDIFISNKALNPSPSQFSTPTNHYSAAYTLPSSPTLGQMAATRDGFYICSDPSVPTWKLIVL